MILPSELIKKKRSGLEHTGDEIRALIGGYVRGEIPDYQVAAWLMAVYFRGMTSNETAALTEAMLHSGRTLDFSHLKKIAVDKHSTGGVGDKTSMILAPIVAAAGVPVPMISGRGLGHTGGTLDKLEAIPGFKTSLTLEVFQRQVETLGVALAGQSEEICPADKKIYALRDVTATVESLPLICASIMSKKLAEGINGLVLDVKYGSGAFMKTLNEAETLAEKLMAIGDAHGKRVAALISNMDQPLGRFIGNALEIGECVAILKREKYLGRNDFDDCRDLSLELAAQMIWLGGRCKDASAGLKVAREILESGQAWEMFEKICRAQGGDVDAIPLAKTRVDVVSEKEGFVSVLDSEGIGLAALTLGAGRTKSTDTIDPTAGLELHVKLGDSVRPGVKLFTLYANLTSSDARIADARERLVRATTISLQKPDVPALIALRKVTRF